MRRVRIAMAALVSAAVVGAVGVIAQPAPEPAPEPAPKQEAAPLTLDRLAWLSGSWKGDALGGLSEEHWTEAAGGSMMGMFRLTRANETTVCEFLLIEQEGDGVVMRFKHYGPGWNEWEKDEPLTLRLARASAEELHFESTKAGQSPRAITYRLSGPDDLVVTVSTERDGQEHSFGVPMRRVLK